MPESQPRPTQRLRSKRFPLLWGIFTCVYAGLVIYRTKALGVGPDVSTLASCFAITAVWLDVIDVTHASVQIRYGVLVAIVMTLVTNVLVGISMFLSGKGVSLERLALTALFLVILRDRTADMRST